MAKGSNNIEAFLHVSSEEEGFSVVVVVVSVVSVESFFSAFDVIVVDVVNVEVIVVFAAVVVVDPDGMRDRL